MFTPPQPNSGNLWAGRTVGLLGGSFNPAHEGHRHISLYAMKMLGLDAVWWMVSPQNPLKSTKDMAPLGTRLANAARAAGHPRIIATDIETRMGTQYTTDTLGKLRRLFPRTQFVWLMGMDNLRQVHRWRDWQDIFHTIPVCVLDRPPRHNSLRTCAAMERFRQNLVPQEVARNIIKNPLPSWSILHIPLNSLSATEIREGNLQKQSKKDTIKA